VDFAPAALDAEKISDGLFHDLAIHARNRKSSADNFRADSEAVLRIGALIYNPVTHHGAQSSRFNVLLVICALKSRT
jgi:hypothetical protein